MRGCYLTYKINKKDIVKNKTKLISVSSQANINELQVLIDELNIMLRMKNF